MLLYFKQLQNRVSRKTEAALVLKALESYVNKKGINFNVCDENYELFWNYFRLKKNYRINSYWETNWFGVSMNDQCLSTLVSYYVKLKGATEQKHSRRSEQIITNLISRHKAVVPLKVIRSKYIEYDMFR